MDSEEIVKLARGYALEFCREHGVDAQDADDYIQEGVLGALGYARGKTTVQKAFIRSTVRGVIMDYHKKWTNAGVGGKDADPMDHVYLSTPIAGDEESEELTYEEALAYPTPPRGYGTPDDEGIGALRAEHLRSVLPRLPSKSRQLIEMLYFQGKTQQEAAAVYGTTQKTVHVMEQAALRMLRKLLEE